jgi:hypothetical protein
VVLTRVQIPATDTVHLEYSAEPLIAATLGGGRGDSSWCLVTTPSGTGENVFVTLVGYTFKP